jgi:hypothetical protein
MVLQRLVAHGVFAFILYSLQMGTKLALELRNRSKTPIINKRDRRYGSHHGFSA